MNANEMFPSKYIKASDLGEHKPTVIIQDVQIEELGSGEDKDRKPVIYFEGKEKGLVCNKTNWNTLIDLYGPDTDNWLKKPIKIYATEVAFQGKMTLAVRISLQKPVVAAKTDKPSKPVVNDDDLAPADVEF
jgi:hypothetical protein